jgi:hypothetical protein
MTSPWVPPTIRVVAASIAATTFSLTIKTISDRASAPPQAIRTNRSSMNPLRLEGEQERGTEGVQHEGSDGMTTFVNAATPPASPRTATQ